MPRRSGSARYQSRGDHAHTGNSSTHHREIRTSSKSNDVSKKRTIEIRLTAELDVEREDTAQQANRSRRLRRRMIDQATLTAKRRGKLKAHGPNDENWKFATPREHDDIEKWTEQEKINKKYRDNIDEIYRTLEAQQRELDLARPFSRAVRSRFLSTFKRDKLKCGDERDTAIIKATNGEVHEGSAYFDALLYKDGQRVDDDTYKQCYGVGWQTVIKLDYTSPLVRAISVRGTIRNKNQISTSPGFNELYESLIHAIENPPDNKFDDNWLKTTTEDCIVRAEICLENLAKELHLAQNSCTASSIV